jgi:hypothetical protein
MIVVHDWECNSIWPEPPRTPWEKNHLTRPLSLLLYVEAERNDCVRSERCLDSGGLAAVKVKATEVSRRLAII